MKPFEVSPHLATLLDSYPNAFLVAEAVKNGGQDSKEAIARLWLSEGIPYAFKAKPALYEVLRSWLGTKLNVNPKEIHLSGSARIGQSLAPRKLGKDFGVHSDLDLFVISSALFSRVEIDFNTWSCQFESDQVQPKNDRENEYWVDNNRRGKINIKRGFIDSKMIPNRTQYPTNQNIAQSMWELKEKLDATELAPRVKSASVRCYKDWGSYVQQMVRSLG